MLLASRLLFIAVLFGATSGKLKAPLEGVGRLRYAINPNTTPITITRGAFIFVN
jgi:hypothetical protein